MKRGSTLFLKIAVILIGIPVLALCIFFVPIIANFAAELYPGISYLKYLVYADLYAAAIPFYFALYQAFKLLSYIDQNKAFSELSVRALKNIKYCAITISILFAAGILALLSYRRDGRRSRDHTDRVGPYFCFNGYRSLCRCSPKAIARSD